MRDLPGLNGYFAVLSGVADVITLPVASLLQRRQQSGEQLSAVELFVRFLCLPAPAFALACGLPAGRFLFTAEQSAQKNVQLSQQRAQAVTSFLNSLGVSNSQIRSTIGYGEANPVADNSTAAGKAQNRRVEVYMYASEAMIKAAEAGTLQ